MQSMVYANKWVHYGLKVVFLHLHITLSHYRHYVDSSEGIGNIKCLSDISCHVCMCNIKSSLSVFFYAYMGLCVFSLPISLLMIVRIFVLDHIIMIKWEIKNNACHEWGDLPIIFTSDMVYWYCDVIFVYYSYRCKLAQRWSSLMTTINIDFSPPSIHGLAYKKYELITIV